MRKWKKPEPERRPAKAMPTHAGSFGSTERGYRKATKDATNNTAEPEHQYRAGAPKQNQNQQHKVRSGYRNLQFANWNC